MMPKKQPALRGEAAGCADMERWIIFCGAAIAAGSSRQSLPPHPKRPAQWCARVLAHQ